MKEWHPDRHPDGSLSHVEATRKSQEINDAYRTIRLAGRHGKVPLRPSRPSAPTASPPMPDLWKDTVGDRVIAGVVGILLGILIDVSLMGGSVVMWVAVPTVLGIACAALGWRSFGAVIRLIMWWFV